MVILRLGVTVVKEISHSNCGLSLTCSTRDRDEDEKGETSESIRELMDRSPESTESRSISKSELGGSSLWEEDMVLPREGKGPTLRCLYAAVTYETDHYTYIKKEK